ncbi:MAG: hypothetical protein GTN46_04820, partial [Gammaproteobacteria bacterium]|nr:hypothetical protein [Gammaproteobacteria bacterium]NIT40853.1 hypothetical protein [Gammaproteobacteria bacterium]
MKTLTIAILGLTLVMIGFVQVHSKNTGERSDMADDKKMQADGMQKSTDDMMMVHTM